MPAALLRDTFLGVTLVRLLVGLVAAAICLAGLGWYAVYLFAPGPPTAATGGTSHVSTPAKLHPAYARRQNRRSVILGSAAVIGVLALTPLALHSIRTGIPVRILNESPTNGWVLLAAIIFVGALGLWVVASGMLKVLRDDR